MTVFQAIEPYETTSLHRLLNDTTNLFLIHSPNPELNVSLTSWIYCDQSQTHGEKNSTTTDTMKRPMSQKMLKKRFMDDTQIYSLEIQWNSLSTNLSEINT